MNAILGTSPCCVASYPGDMAVALLALNAGVRVVGPGGVRTLPIDDLHRVPGDTPERHTNLQRDELITDILLPSMSFSRRSLFIKLRDRASFEWAFASAAIAMDLNGDTVRQVHLAVGGLATKPWRMTQVEKMMRGRKLNAMLAEQAGMTSLADTEPRLGLMYKLTVLRRLVQRIVLHAGDLA